jgi:hypothetical protein
MINNFLIKRFYGLHKHEESFSKNLENNSNVLTDLNENDPFERDFYSSLDKIGDSLAYLWIVSYS